MLVLQGQAVEVVIQRHVRVVAKLDGAFVPRKGKGQAAGHHLVRNLHGRVGHRQQVHAGVVGGGRNSSDRIADKGTDNVLEAPRVLVRLVGAEAGVFLVLDDALDQRPQLLTGRAPLVQRIPYKVEKRSDLHDVRVRLVVPAQPEFGVQDFLLNVLEHESGNEMHAVLGGGEHEESMLWSRICVLVAGGDLEDVFPQLRVVLGSFFHCTWHDLGSKGLCPAIDAGKESEKHVLPDLGLWVKLGVIAPTENKSAGLLRVGAARGLTGRPSLCILSWSAVGWGGIAVVSRRMATRWHCSPSKRRHGRTVCVHGVKSTIRNQSAVHGAYRTHGRHHIRRVRRHATSMDVVVSVRTTGSSRRRRVGMARGMEIRIQFLQILQQEFFVLAVQGRRIPWLRKRRRGAVGGQVRRGRVREAELRRGIVVVARSGRLAELAAIAGLLL